MTIIEQRFIQPGVTTRQRWSNYFAVLLGVIAVVTLLNLRASIVTATVVYRNDAEGIVATYPQNWLIDENGGVDYIFRVRNMQEVGFKTTFRVSAIPTSTDTARRTVLDALAMERAQTFSNYRILSVEPYTGLGETEASIASYQYIATDQNPFQQSLPAVVQGVDVLVLSREQAIVITMLSDAASFEENSVLFERFLTDLEF